MSLNDPIVVLTMRFALNAVATLLLMFGMYYRRYRDKELATTAAMFNVFAFAFAFAFAFLTILWSVEFSVAAGFGLFGILALFSLRSEAISKIEICYFFGSVAIAVICSVVGTSLGFADRLPRFAGERPTGHCSKYCIGLAATGQVSRFNHFLPGLRKLGLTTSTPRIGQWSAMRSNFSVEPPKPAMA